jgi:FtsX-like permease family
VSRLGSLWPLARLAWRDAIRHPGRSLLIAAMLALPTAELAGTTVLLRYSDLKATMSLGGNNPFLVLWLTTLAAAALTAVAGLSVGASRQLRELGLLAANGAGRWQLRTLVLLQGVGLGLLGGVAGILGGLAATWVAFPVMRGWLTPVTDEHFTVLVPQFSVRASDLRWVLAFTVAVALLAALGPARRAARLPAQAALAGRHQQPRRRRRRLVLLGAALTLAGIAEQVLVGYVSYYGEVAPLPLQLLFGGDEGTITVGLVAVLVGAALAAPALLDLAGRHPPRRPTVLRLAARDAARQPGRSGPAVAAIAAGLGFMVVLASQVPNHSYFNGYDYSPEPLLWSPPFPVALRVLLGLVAGVTVLVVLAVTALGRAEAEAELATLTAVGAAPNTLRGLAAASAWLLTQAGALLGTLAAVSLLAAQRAADALGLPVGPVPVPWVMLGLVLLAIPALAALAAAITTSRAAVTSIPKALVSPR